MRNNNVVAKKMAKNGLKIANSLGYAFHFESDFTLEEGKRGEVRGSLIRDHMLLCQVSNVSLMPPCYTVC